MTGSNFIALKVASATTQKDVESQGRAIEALAKILDLWTKNVQDNTSALTELRAALVALNAQILASGENNRAALVAVQAQISALQASLKVLEDYKIADLQKQLDALAYPDRNVK